MLTIMSSEPSHVKLSDLQLFEQLCAEEWDTDQLFEMANLHTNAHGIPDVVIWVGLANKQHGLRVKVSNQKNRFDPTDHFVIQMPSLDYNPNAVASWITTKHLQMIFNWIKLNQQVLVDYENGGLDDTREFLQRISPV